MFGKCLGRVEAEMERTRLTWLLLALSCLVHCVHADDSTATPTIPKTATAKVLTTGVSTAPSIATSPRLTIIHVPTTITSQPAVITEKRTTGAVPTTPSHITAAPSNPPTTAKPTNPPSVAPTEKPSTPSSGRSAVITSVSKPKENPTTIAPKSHHPSVTATVMGLTPLQTLAISTKHSPVQTTPPKTGASVSVPQNSGDTRTTKVTDVSVTATTVKGTASIHVTTKHDAKATGTTALVTSKSSPQQNLGPTGSTAPSTTPHTPESTSKPHTTVTGGTTGLHLVSVSPMDSRVQTTAPQTTVPATTTPTATTAAPVPQKFSYSLNKGHQSEEEKDLVSLCQRLMGSLEDGNCTVSFRHRNSTVLFDSVEITGKVKTTIVTQQFEDITKKPTDNRTLITILASCGALLIMIIILAVCASHHRRPYSENQQHLTEELQTVENGYHDNPTLEVMEVGADMQEKKPPLSLNNGGDFNDSWIVPIDNLLKEEGPDEEDTHL